MGHLIQPRTEKEPTHPSWLIGWYGPRFLAWCKTRVRQISDSRANPMTRQHHLQEENCMHTVCNQEYCIQT